MLFFRKRQIEKDRRVEQRSEPTNRIVAAAARLVGGAVFAVRVLDSSGGGASIDWPVGTDRRPAVDAGLELEIRMAGSEVEHRIESRVIHLEEESGSLRVGLQFVDPDRDLARLRPVDRPFFDRRRFPRYRLDETVWVDFALGPICLCGRLVDLSLGGLAMTLAPGLAGTIEAGTRGRLTFLLPGDFMRIEIEAELRRRRDGVDGSCLGLLFEPGAEGLDPRLGDFLAALPEDRKV